MLSTAIYIRFVLCLYSWFIIFRVQLYVTKCYEMFVHFFFRLSGHGQSTKKKSNYIYIYIYIFTFTKDRVSSKCEALCRTSFWFKKVNCGSFRLKFSIRQKVTFHFYRTYIVTHFEMRGNTSGSRKKKQDLLTQIDSLRT